MKRQQYKSISPEVEHLLAAVKAVKRGLVPEKAKLPIPEDELDNEEVVLEEEDNKV